MEQQNTSELPRIQRLYQHPLYQNALQKTQQAEQKRIYCRHNLQHFLDVARLAWIYNLEKQMQLKKELVYATALLHDIGRYQEYETGIEHDIASAALAEQILPEAGFDEREQQQIVTAILAHRKLPDEQSELAEALYWADKKSRSCYACTAEPTCYWAPEKKNWYLEW